MPDAPFPTLVSRLRDLAADPDAGTTDADLLRRFTRDRDPVAFEALVWRHARLVMGVCRRALRHHQDAEDAFQAVFLLLARKGHRIRRGAALPGWLHTTAVRVARRARSRRRPVPVAEVPDRPTTDPPPEFAEAWAVLDEEVRRLPARLRAAFVLCGLEGRTHADAARELGCPKGTVDSRMRAAKRRLQVVLARRGLTLTPVAALAAVVPELAYSEAVRRAVVFSSGRLADVSPAVAGLLAPTRVSRWVVGLGAALALATAGTLAVLPGMTGPGEQPKKSSVERPDDGPKVEVGERRVPGTTPLFKRTTVGVPEDLDRDREVALIEWLERLFATVTEERRKAGKPLIPPSIPSALGNRIVFVHDKGVGALALFVDKTADPPVHPGDLLWTSASDLWRKYLDLYGRRALEMWLEDQPDSGQYGGIVNRTLGGVLSSQKGEISWLEDLVWLPNAERLRKAREAGPDQGKSLMSLSPFFEEVHGNVVRVVDPATGKLLTKLDRDRKRAAELDWDRRPAAEPTPFGGNLYLGPPFPVGDHSALIHEKNHRLRVTCVASWDDIGKASLREKGDWTRQLISAANSTRLWDTELVTTPTSVVADPHRRIHAIHLVRAGDLIVCPTHLGRVVAVDVKTGQKKWTHEYAPLDAKRFPTFAPEWVVVPPVVAGNRYVYAPADFPELLCLNVADGKKAWSVQKGDGLYPAVVGEQVLVIGAKAIRSLSLKDGSEQWKADLPGLPCGRGAVLGDTYLVPVSEPKTWKGMIAVVDLKAGKMIEVLKPEKEEPIGNLVVHQDYLISQTLTEIAVFPIKKRE